MEEATCDAAELVARDAAGIDLMPPLPPPNGRFMSEHFHVIMAARALKSSSEASWW